MAGMTAHLVKAYRNDANVRVLKSTVLVVGVANGAGYAAAPGAANAGKIVGVSLEDVCENDINPWVGGVAQIQTGQAPAAGARTLLGRNISVAKDGIVPVIAASAIAAGDWVNINDAQGRIKTVNEAGGTLVNVLGMAETAAAAAGDVIRVSVNIHSRHQ